MRCDELSGALVDLVDGRLDTIEIGRAEAHLAECPGCRALVADLRTVRAAARSLDRREPPARVWTAIAGAIAREPRPVPRVRAVPARVGWAPWLAAAAVLLAATAIGLWPLLRAPAPPPAVTGGSTPSVESVTAEFEAAERHYQKAITDLETIARQDTGELDPQVAAVLQKNLTVIDQAIAENRMALQSQPSSGDARAGLFDALRTKVAVLQQTVELINEMRQGNQAEAARRVQTLPR